MSKNMFELITSDSALSGNTSYANLEFTEVPPLRTIDPARFDNGDLIFRWSNSSNQWFDPLRVFTKIDIQLTKEDGVTPLDTDEIAIATGTASLLFDKIELFLNNKSIEVLNSGTIPVIDMVLNRINKTGDYLDNGEGQSKNNYNSSFSERNLLYSSVGGNTKYQTGQSLIWTPPMSIFFNSKTYYPVGDYEIRFSPSTTYAQQAIESINGNKTNGAGNDYLFKVLNMSLFIPQINGIRMSNINYLMDIERYNVQTANIRNVTNSLQKFVFQVPQATYKCAIGFRYAKNDNNNYSPSNIKSVSSTPSTTEKYYYSTDMYVSKLYCQYKGLTKPAPQVEQAYTPLGDNTLGFRYNYSFSNSNAFNPYDSKLVASHESLEDYIIRGPFLLIDWASDSTNKSNLMTVFAEFSSITGGTDTQIVLMTWSRSVAKVSVIEDKVNAVSIEEH